MVRTKKIKKPSPDAEVLRQAMERYRPIRPYGDDPSTSMGLGIAQEFARVVRRVETPPQPIRSFPAPLLCGDVDLACFYKERRVFKHWYAFPFGRDEEYFGASEFLDRLAEPADVDVTEDEAPGVPIGCARQIRHLKDAARRLYGITERAPRKTKKKRN